MELKDKMKKIRLEYGLSASKMALILGFGANQWRLYESGTKPNASNSILINLTLNPFFFQNILLVLSEETKADIGLKSYYILHKRINEICAGINEIVNINKDALVYSVFNDEVISTCPMTDSMPHSIFNEECECGCLVDKMDNGVKLISHMAYDQSQVQEWGVFEQSKQ